MEIKELAKKIKRKILNALRTDSNLPAKERKKLSAMPRYTPAITQFFGKNLEIVDALTFLSSYEEIFKNEIYRFSCDKKDMLIIDCGANIGLASLYFKMKFPQAKVIAFEPDPNIFNALRNNMHTFGHDDINCLNEAISNLDTTLKFWQEGGHSGMIMNDTENTITTQVKAIRFRSFLSKYEKVTFLKIDIEGEEARVIPDIADQLHKVDFLFLEYHSFMESPQTLGDLLNYITAAGMKYYIKEAVDKKFPFLNREIFLKMDMLVNIFCYR